MEWVLFVSLQWIVLGSPTNSTTQTIDRFVSEELCNKAAEAIRAEINAPIEFSVRKHFPDEMNRLKYAIGVMHRNWAR